MSEQRSQIHGRATKVIFPREDPTLPPHEELIIDVGVDCPDCGKVSMTIPGHHLRALHQLLGQFLEEFPSTHLSGELGEEKERFNFASRGPQKPNTN